MRFKDIVSNCIGAICVFGTILLGLTVYVKNYQIVESSWIEYRNKCIQNDTIEDCRERFNHKLPMMEKK